TVANITVGKDPTAIAYNAANHLLYVADSGAHNVSVINSSQEKVVATVPVGNFPSGLGIDTVSDLVDVPADNGGGQSNVTIIDGSNNTVRGVVGVGMDASSIAFSAPSGRMFVVNGGSNNVSVISQSTGKVVKTLAVGHGSVNIEYDAINQEVYSANYESGNVSIINASTEKIDNTIPTNNFPFWSTVDPATGSVYVVNSGSSNTQSNLTVIARTQLASPIGSIPLAVYPYGLVYDSGSASLFTGDPGGSTTYQVGPGSNLVTSVTAVGLHPQHLAYDTINHDLFVVNQGSENLTVLDASLAPVASVPVGISPTGIAFDPSNGFLYVSDNYGGNVTVINGTNDHVQTVITIKPYDLLTAVLYDPHSNHLYVTDASGSNVSVINGATDKVLKSIHVGLEPDSLAYDSSNNTVFVANTGSGNLSVINDSSDSIAHTVPVYSAGLLAYDAGRNIVFDANSYSPVVYPVNASNYTVWGPSIPLGGSQAVSGIAYDPTTEETVVASEDDGILSFLGVRGAAYPVTFQESGLPNGTTRSVTFGGLPNSSKTTDIGFSVGNGSASFSVGAVTGFTVNRSSGSVDVLGAPVVVDLGFSASASIGQADFSETGLPQGTGWNVTYNGVQQGSTTPEIDFAVPAGSHGFTVPDSGSYVPSPASGNLGVTAGGTSDQLIQFAGGSPPGALRVTLTADPSSFGLGATTVLKSTVSGGTAPYTFVYTILPAGCASANSSTLSCTPTASGTVNVTVTVTDPAGDTGHNMTQVAVSGSSPPNNGHQGTSSQSSGLPPWAWWILLLIAILALVAGLIAYRRRRKDRPAPSNGNPPAPPAIGPGAPPPPPP
ncbi:MAG: hypothetical protein L3J96_03620, partial [Thermoplasmata archaeon]|nr:hypothetical protein [Thermoplasmata archaeon]